MTNMDETTKTDVSVCSKCKTEKPISDFYRDHKKKRGIVSRCKTCCAEDQRSRNERRSERLREKRKLQGSCDPALQKKYSSTYYKKNREKIIQKSRAYYEENKDALLSKHLARKANRRKTDESFYIRDRLSALVRSGFYYREKQKDGSVWKALGYTPGELAEHLERQFLDGMGWHNRSEWHIDHIIPTSSFQYQSMNDEGFLQCWSLANLRPIWKKDNLMKSAKVEFLI